MAQGSFKISKIVFLLLFPFIKLTFIKTFISTTKNAQTAYFFAVLESTYFLKFFW